MGKRPRKTFSRIIEVFWTFFETIDFSVISRISPVSLGVIASRFIFGFRKGFFTGAFAPPLISFVSFVSFVAFVAVVA
jgi:hypothetical protein